jgi:hypothetical protein
VRAASEAGPLLRGVVTNCTLVRLEGGRAVLDCPERLRPQALKQAQRLGEVFSREHGSAIVVEIIDPEALAAQASEPGAAQTPAHAVAPRAEPTDVSEHPLVKQALELFGARVVDVQPRRS